MKKKTTQGVMRVRFEVTNENMNQIIQSLPPVSTHDIDNHTSEIKRTAHFVIRDAEYTGRSKEGEACFTGAIFVQG